MELGDRITYKASTPTRYESEGVWVNPGDPAIVVEIHPPVPGTGQILYTDDDGPVTDNGLEGYAVIQFENGARRAIPLEEQSS